ncbi:group III truncated hemoglobin [Pedobacter sp. SAFR-022]|uniref:group III truncated hemoglobin n=1 Tax=Pedobacter sp. SAFR-022 TaxID=3436861 RepID=UPI003F814755
MEKRTDIGNEDDVALLVHTFYAKVRADDLLGPIFEPIIKDNWAPHLNRMVDFWSTILLYTRKYKDDPMPKHLQLPVEQRHFDRWLSLFNETLDALFAGEVAENAKLRAASIARIMMVIRSRADGLPVL